MNTLIYLTIRNIKLYLRDKSSVFFSLISSLIIIALFVLFMGKAYIDNTVDMFNQVGQVERVDIQVLIFSWILGGIIVLNSINVPQMILSRIILDKETKAMNDFYVIPFNRSLLALSYIASAIIVGTIITYFSFLIGELYIFMISGTLFSLEIHGLVFLITVLCTTSFSSILYLIYLFVKTSSTIGGINAFTSSIGGFLAGIYITIGGLSGVTKDIVSSNPLAHATALVRSVIMGNQMRSAFSNLPTQTTLEFGDIMGVNLYVGATQLTNLHYVLGLCIIAVVCFALSYMKLQKDKL